MKRTPEQLENDAAVRASGIVRRAIRRNRGKFLWTFTFADATYDLLEVLAAVAHFQRELRLAFGPTFFLLVPEPHPGGHGWHLHGATNQFLSIEVVRSCWGKGNVWVGDHGRKRRRWNSRLLARYLSKYMFKALGGTGLYGCLPRQKGQHRYWLTQGFAVLKVRKAFASMRAAVLWVLAHYGMWDKETAIGADGTIPVEGWHWEFPDKCLKPRWPVQ